MKTHSQYMHGVGVGEGRKGNLIPFLAIDGKTALPPWVVPIQAPGQGQQVMDGAEWEK